MSELAERFKCSLCGRTRAAECFKIGGIKRRRRNTRCIDCQRVYDRALYAINGRRPAKKHAEKDPEKLRARHLLQLAIRHGKMQRQPCSVCGAKADAHHEDYSKPYEVSWLCRKHHMKQHRLPTDTPISETALIARIRAATFEEAAKDCLNEASYHKNDTKAFGKGAGAAFTKAAERLRAAAEKESGPRGGE